MYTLFSGLRYYCIQRMKIIKIIDVCTREGREGEREREQEKQKERENFEGVIYPTNIYIPGHEHAYVYI